jgi:hypothetical protein
LKVRGQHISNILGLRHEIAIVHAQLNLQARNDGKRYSGGRKTPRQSRIQIELAFMLKRHREIS